MPGIAPLKGARLLEVTERASAYKGARTATQRDSCPSLVFDTGILRISNPFMLTCDSGETVDFNSLIGCCVSDACSTEQEFFIVFEGRITLIISLREEDFIGPEAATYQANSGETVTVK